MARTVRLVRRAEDPLIPVENRLLSGRERRYGDKAGRIRRHHYLVILRHDWWMSSARAATLTFGFLLALAVLIPPSEGRASTGDTTTSTVSTRPVPSTLGHEPAWTAGTLGHAPVERPLAMDATPPTTAGHTTTATSDIATTTTELARTFTLAFTGDVLLHTRVNEVAAANAAEATDGRTYDFRPMLAPIQPLVEAVDRAVCHLEVNLSADGTRLSSYPSFRGPGQVAFDLADVGYDSCTLASNHILDKGVDGIYETLGVLDEAGLEATGAARVPEEAVAQRLFEIDGTTVGHLSYTYGFNGIPLPEDAPWVSNLIDEDRIMADAAAVRSAGAEYVVVSLHWGTEYQHQPDDRQRDLGPRVLASPDVDLVVGHHAHVVQPVARFGDEWLIYGLGNLLSNQEQLPRRDGLLVVATITEQRDGDFATDLRVVPLHLDNATLTVYPTSPTARPVTIGSDLAASLDASWNRVNDVLGRDESPAGLTIG